MQWDRLYLEANDLENMRRMTRKDYKALSQYSKDMCVLDSNSLISLFESEDELQKNKIRKLSKLEVDKQINVLKLYLEQIIPGISENISKDGRLNYTIIRINSSFINIMFRNNNGIQNTFSGKAMRWAKMGDIAYLSSQYIIDVLASDLKKNLISYCKSVFRYINRHHGTGWNGENQNLENTNLDGCDIEDLKILRNMLLVDLMHLQITELHDVNDEPYLRIQKQSVKESIKIAFKGEAYLNSYAKLRMEKNYQQLSVIEKIDHYKTSVKELDFNVSENTYNLKEPLNYDLAKNEEDWQLIQM